MMGKGPTRDRPRLPKSMEDVTRRPAPRGYAALGIMVKMADMFGKGIDETATLLSSKSEL